MSLLRRTVPGWEELVRGALRIALIAIAILSSAGIIKAASIYTATGAACTSFAQVNGTGAVVLSPGANPCGGGITAEMFARADTGGVGASAAITYICCGSSGTASGHGRAEVDFIITGPTSTVSTSLNTVLRYSFGGGTSSGTGTHSVDILANVNGALFIGNASQTTGPNASESVSGNYGLLLGTCASYCNFTTPVFTLPVNTPLFMILDLTVVVGAGGNTAVATVDAKDTLYFPSIGPVFNLPAGYTVNIPGLNVVNNQVVGASTAVPEPATWALSLAALGALTARRRFSRQP